MKNKTVTYVLIAVVVGVWYQVFVRVKSNFVDETGETIQNQSSIIDFNPIQRDTFQLLANYRDPFGGATQITINNDQIELFENSPKPSPPVKIEAKWPKIIYYGLVRKTDSNNPLGIINIDGMLLHLRKGETIFDDIKIVTVGRDSIQVKYDKKQKTFWRD